MLKMSKEDFMKEAIKDAKNNNRSFGAIIVKDNKIISKAGKLSNSIPICHPETQAIFNAIRKMSKNLGNCTLYSTCEPCAMCFYMAWLASIDEIVYGASLIDSIVLGYKEINLGVQEMNKKGHNMIKLNKGILKEECRKIMRTVPIN